MLKPHILILAAGLGKRMRSSIPKVMHPVLFQPMIHHVLDLAFSVPRSSVSMVVGHGEELVRESCAKYKGVNYVTQTEQKGTAHAVNSASGFLKKQKGQVLILSGDVCLLRKSSLEGLLKVHAEQKPSLSLVTSRTSEPFGYGRILRDPEGRVCGIREEADASEEEKKVTEINAGIYCFEIDALLECLKKIEPRNRQGEFYLTDSVEILVKQKAKIIGFELADFAETLGVNDRAALAHAEKVLQTRRNRELMLQGVTLHQPETILIDMLSDIAPDCEIWAGTQIIRSQIGKGTLIESACHISGCKISENVRIKQGSYLEESEVGAETSVGPYAHLRPGSKLGAQVKVGNFVEVKKSVFKEGAKASHLSYIGDAEIGKNVNLGCGFVTCNYDGVTKHKTVIEDNVFVGSDSQTVAPVKIGKGSYVASGTTVTSNVPKDSLVVSRGRQVTKPGYAKKYLKK